MSAPLKPWRESEDGDRAARLVREVSGIAPRPVDVARGWDGVIERVARPRHSRLWLVAAGAAVLLAWASLRWPPNPPAPTPHVALAPLPPAECAAPQMCVEEPTERPVVAAPVRGPRPTPRAAPAAVDSVSPPPLVEAAPSAPQNVRLQAAAWWSAPDENALKLERGRVEVEPHGATFTVTTPEVSLASSFARYAADVTEAGTVVHVFEGEIEALAVGNRQALTLRAGEERIFPSAPGSSALDVVPPAVSSPACARHSVEQRVACLLEEAHGDGLRAQAALYEAAYLRARAGKVEAATVTLRESLRRFPHGVLNPEVRLSLIKTLVAEKRLAEAAEVAEQFLAECDDDPRATEVEAFLRTLAWLESR